jgi:hypothetical protein
MRTRMRARARAPECEDDTHARTRGCSRARARMQAHVHAQVDARARPRARADVARRSWGMGPRVGGARNGIVETSKHMCPRSCTRERTGPVPRMLAVSARRARVLGVTAGGVFVQFRLWLYHRSRRSAAAGGHGRPVLPLQTHKRRACGRARRYAGGNRRTAPV